MSASTGEVRTWYVQGYGACHILQAGLVIRNRAVALCGTFPPSGVWVTVRRTAGRPMCKRCNRAWSKAVEQPVSKVPS